MVAYELLHSLKNTRRGKGKKMAMKLDMSKTYDRVEWSYLEAVMKALGFKDQWVKLIMSCITSITYSMLVNGKSGKAIFSSRGLRQGDSLSPYFFLICAKGFSTLINKSDQLKKIQGARVVKEGTSISHLLFPDDIILFIKQMLMNGEECKK